MVGNTWKFSGYTPGSDAQASFLVELRGASEVLGSSPVRPHAGPTCCTMALHSRTYFKVSWVQCLVDTSAGGLGASGSSSKKQGGRSDPDSFACRQPGINSQHPKPPPGVVPVCRFQSKN